MALALSVRIIVNERTSGISNPPGIFGTPFAFIFSKYNIYLPMNKNTINATARLGTQVIDNSGYFGMPIVKRLPQRGCNVVTFDNSSALACCNHASFQ
jgi:hypothetical protein